MDESKKPEIKKVASKKPAPLSEKKSPVAPEKKDLFFDEISSQLDMLLSDDADDISPKADETITPPAKTDDPMEPAKETRKPVPVAEEKKPAVKDIEPESRTDQKEKDARPPAVKKAELPTETANEIRKPAPATEEKKPAVKGIEPEVRTVQKEEIPTKESDGKFKHVKTVKESKEKNLQVFPRGKPAPERKPPIPLTPSGEKQHKHMKFHAPPRSPVKGKEKDTDAQALQKPEDTPKVAVKEKKIIKKVAPLKAAEKDLKHVEIAKGPKVKKQKTRQKSFFVYGLLGILAVSAVAALSTFWGSPEQSNRTEPVKIVPTHKIARPPVKIQANRKIPPEKKKAPPPLLSNTAKKPAPRPKVPKKIKPIIPVGKADPATDIDTFLVGWEKAWENSAGKQGDIKTYMTFYAASFFSKGFDKNRWEQDKRLKNRRKDWIQIDLKNIQIGPVKDDRVQVRFLQDYRSSNYSGISYKTLMLKKEPAGWRIIGTETTSGSFPYSIYMSSYRSKVSAEKDIKEYRNRGLQAFWARADLGEKGVWFRVFIGCYKTFGEGQKIITNMQLTNAKPVQIKYANAIGTYSSEDNLKKEIRKLSDNGYSSYFVKDDGGNSHLYVGAFYTLQNAEKLSTEMRSRGIRSQVVRR